MTDAKLSVLEQLQQLKGITIRTGLIHEAQAVQLRNYPRIVEGITKATTKLDTDSRSVIYTCEAAPGFKLSKKRRLMCDNIVVWIRTVIWDDTSVVFEVNGKAIYDSGRPEKSE